MNDKRLEEIEKRVDVAASHRCDASWICSEQYCEGDIDPDIPYLLSEVRRLQRVEARLRDALNIDMSANDGHDPYCPSGENPSGVPGHIVGCSDACEIKRSALSFDGQEETP